MLHKRGRSFWDYTAWVILFLIALWIVLKLIGVINTPIWLEYSPLFGLIYLAGWGMSKLDNVTTNVKEIKDDVNSLWDDTKKIESDMNILRKKCPKL
jgi:hypothetical protein